MPTEMMLEELQRLDALDDLQILGTPPEDTFDDFAELASAFCETPISLISLVGAEGVVA